MQFDAVLSSGLPSIRDRLPSTPTDWPAPLTFGTAITLAAERVVVPIEGIHRATAERWFRRLGPVAEPVRFFHDSILGIVYSTIQLANAGIGIGIDRGFAVGERATTEAHAVVNGIWGDSLGEHEESIGISMGLRGRDGELIAVGSNLSEHYPEGNGHLVVLLHGLFDTERRFGSIAGQPSLYSALEAHPELTPLALRYNSGLGVADNGEQLATLIESVHAEWPVPIRSISLLGYSMGGLVARSACLAATDADHSWIGSLRNVVTLATPHRGSPLEKAANIAAQGLRITHRTRPLADFLDSRSAGLKDLRFGAVASDDSSEGDPDAVREDQSDANALPPDVRHHFVGGVITADPDHPFGRAVGDLVVRSTSSSGGPGLIPTQVSLYGGTNHLDLLRDPSVITAVVEWVSPPDWDVDSP